MIWFEPSLMIYSSALGAGVGAFVMGFALKRWQSDYIKLLEHYWQSEIKQINNAIDHLEMMVRKNNLSTKYGDKHVREA